MRASYEKQVELPSGLTAVVSEYPDGRVRFKVKGASSPQPKFTISDVVLFGEEWTEVVLAPKP